jgi:hypothetical protein
MRANNRIAQEPMSKKLSRVRRTALHAPSRALYSRASGEKAGITTFDTEVCSPHAPPFLASTHLSAAVLNVPVTGMIII